jgi:hypothetical protein
VAAAADPIPSRDDGPGAWPRGLPLAASVLALATTGALPPPSAAQVSVGAALVPAFESLSPEGAARESRATIDGGLDAEALFASERGRVFYTLDAGTYSTPGDWSFLQHDAGLTWRIGDTAGPHAFLGISGTLRRNGDAWAAADYGAVGAKANLAWSPRAGLTLRAGVRVDARQFDDIPALDQVEGSGFASILANLPSRTSLIGEVLLGGKSYAGETILVPYDEPSAPPEARGASGRGSGAGGMGPGLRPPAGLPVTEGDESAGQFTWLVRAAQSLGPLTGLSLQYSRRSVFGSVPPVVVTTPALLFEDGVYDDPYASEASAVRGALKHVFAGGAEAQIEGYWLDKAYVSTVALDGTGEPLPDGALRKDAVWRAAAAASVPVFGSRTGSVSLALELRWEFTRHRSNDAFYRYDAQALGVGVSAAY